MSNSTDSKDLLAFGEELYAVTEAAHDAVYDAMEDGVERGYRGNWRGQSAVVHLGHAFRHVEEALGDMKAEDAMDHIEHAICRLSMAVVKWYDAEISCGDTKGPSESRSDTTLDPRKYGCGPTLTQEDWLRLPQQNNTIPVSIKNIKNVV